MASRRIPTSITVSAGIRPARAGSIFGPATANWCIRSAKTQPLRRIKALEAP